MRSACSDNRGMAAIVSSALNRLANCAFRPIPAPRCGPRFHLELPPCGSTRSEWLPTSYPHCCCHNSGMVAITIRDVPTHVRDELAARAARAGQSFQEYLRGLWSALRTSPPPMTSSHAREPGSRPLARAWMRPASWPQRTPIGDDRNRSISGSAKVFDDCARDPTCCGEAEPAQLIWPINVSIASATLAGNASSASARTIISSVTPAACAVSSVEGSPAAGPHISVAPAGHPGRSPRASSVRRGGGEPRPAL